MLIHLVTFWTATDKSLWKLQINNNILYNKVMGSNPIQAWIFCKPSFHYCLSSVHTVKIAFIFMSLSTVQIYNFHIFTAVYSPLHGFIWNQHSDQLPVGLLAQLVEHCTSIAEVMGSNPIQAWIFFRPSFPYCLSSVHNCEDCFHIHVLISAVQIYDFLVFTAQYF